MVSVTRKEIIKGFMEKAKEEVTGLKHGFNQGFKSAIGLAWCWISFEAFTTIRYNKDKVRDRINHFCQEYSSDYDYSSMPDEFKTNLIGLKGYSVLDMRPSHLTDASIQIQDVNNLNEIIEVIYRVRNNLLHGGKDMNEEKDMALVLCASKVLYYILEKVLTKENLI